MAGPNAKKRSHQEFSVKNRLKAQRPLKKKKQKAYHSDSDEDENDNANFKPVNLQDSDEEEASHAGAAQQDSSSDNSDSDPGADSDGEASGRQKLKPKRQKPAAKAQSKPKGAKKVEKEEEKEAASNSGEDNDDDDDDDDDDLDENDEFDISAGDDSDADAAEAGGKKAKSKRNDPSAFSNSLHKILSTKLATTRRADPLLSRSADAHKAAQAITDEQLESKAKRKLRQERLAALEKGRVRDVLVAPTNDQGQVEGEYPSSRAAPCAAALPRGSGARLTMSNSEHRPNPREGEAAPQSSPEGCHQTVQRRPGRPDQECRRREGDAPARLRRRQGPRRESDGDEPQGLPGLDCQQRRGAQKGAGRGGVKRRKASREGGRRRAQARGHLVLRIMINYLPRYQFQRSRAHNCASGLICRA